MSDLYPSLKPMKVERPKRDEKKSSGEPGSITQSEFNQRRFKELFKRGQK